MLNKIVYSVLSVALGMILGVATLLQIQSSTCGQPGRTDNTPRPMAPMQPLSSQQNPNAIPRVTIPPSGAPLSLPTQQGGYDHFTTEEKVNIRVYENTNRSVVNINTKSVRANWFAESVSEGEGSGSILSTEGFVLTNCHVIAEGSSVADEIQVTLFNGKSYRADIVGVDPANDIAVLKIPSNPSELFPVVMGNSAELRVGQRIFAIGNPFGLERTLTVGIISSLNRTLPSREKIRTIKQVIQIDAAINPGNSGGPLMDSRGQMVGMNTAIASKTGQSAGVGFAIPSNTIARIVPQLIKHGKVIRPNIGIEKAFQTDIGLMVAQLEDGGPAERAGLRGPQIVIQQKRIGNLVGNVRTLDRSAADLIVSVDGTQIKNGDDFLTAIESKRPGDTVVLGIVREGRPIRVPIQLEESR